MSKQIFMVEILVDKINVFMGDEGTDSNLALTLKMKFGPKEVAIINENQLVDIKHKDPVVDIDDSVFKKKWVRLLRVGRSWLFMSYPDQIVVTLSRYPIEFELWTDAANEKQEVIGTGIMMWDAVFYEYLKEAQDSKVIHEPIAIKQTIVIYAECCCGRFGTLDIILRLSALGESITTEYQEVVGSNHFVFRTDKAPSMFRCERIKGDDINFLMVGSVYETTTLEDPKVLEEMQPKLDVCTEVSNCNDDGTKRVPKTLLTKIKMGHIAGPCGNTNCPLAHKIKSYLRNLNIYKDGTKGMQLPDKNAREDRQRRKPCGSCDCKDGRWHKDTCPESIKKQQPLCEGCGKQTRSGETCADRIKKLSKNPQINYVTNITRDPELIMPLFGQEFLECTSAIKSIDPKLTTPMFGEDFICNSIVTSSSDSKLSKSVFEQEFIVNPCDVPPGPNRLPAMRSCSCGHSTQDNQDNQATECSGGGGKPRRMGNLNAIVYNADLKSDGGKRANVFCTDMPEEKDKECKCNPVVPTPPCKAFDCECLILAKEKESRRKHKSWCPAYMHLADCPVTKMNDKKEEEEEEDDVEPLPYGLPPVQLGPCPVLSRPCSVPDGYARMYKIGATPMQPPSYSEAGKVCCSKEFDRIRKAIGKYMAEHEKQDDYKCLNKFNVDTDRRCCDKELRIQALLEKSCCGSKKNDDCNVGGSKPKN